MSEVSSSPKFIVMKDPSTSTVLQPTFNIILGSKVRTMQPYTSINNSDTATQWSIIPPDAETVIRRNVWIGMPVRITMTKPDDEGFPIVNYGVTDAFSAFPLNSIMGTLSATFNNLSISQPQSDYFPWIARYGVTNNQEKGYYSTFPSYQDRSQSYDELVYSNENPLSNYGNGSIPGEFKRGQVPIYIITNTNTQFEAVAFLLEPILMSPFNIYDDDQPGFYGIRTFTLNITWDSNRGKIWSKAFVNPLNPITLNVSFQGVSGLPSYIPSQPTLYLQYDTPYTPSPLSEARFIKYHQLDRYPTSFGSLGPGLLYENATFQNIQLTGIPSRIIILFREQNSDLSFSNPRTMAFIRSVNITFMNTTGILSTFSPFDLWEIGKKNGYMGTLTDWIGEGKGQRSSGPGSILALDFGKDIALPDGYAPGMGGSFQLLVKATFQNIANRTINFTGYIITVSAGEFHTVDGGASTSINFVTPDVVKSIASYDVKEIHYDDFYGGFGISDAKSMLGMLARGYNKLLPTVQKGLSKVGEFAKKFEGYGYGGTKRSRMSDYEGGDFASLDELEDMIS